MYWDELRAGKITDQDWLGVEGGIARSYGTCMTMGTASTMTAIARRSAWCCPAAPPSRRGCRAIRAAPRAGRRIVEMVWEDLTPQRIQTRAAFENAIAVAMAMGCSTNAIIHLIAMARRAGPARSASTTSSAQPQVPVIGNVRPSGTIPDGGLLLRRRHPGADGPDRAAPAPRLLTVHGRTLGREHRGREGLNDDVIRTLDNPIYGEGRSRC
jgi:dihydroxy-acid dehydratase